jgi:hypothetical protein
METYAQQMDKVVAGVEKDFYEAHPKRKDFREWLSGEEGQWELQRAAKKAGVRLFKCKYEPRRELVLKTLIAEATAQRIALQKMERLKKRESWLILF